MKSFGPGSLAWGVALSGFAGVAVAFPTWPASIDELEDVMFLNTGYRSRGFGEFVTPCSKGLAAGRNTAAEWLRMGFHDMSTTNINFAPHGGIDSSLAYELNSGENIGAGFETTFQTYGGFLNSRLSTSDLIALGVYASTRSCGGPQVPIRGGRVDVFVAGPVGVPQPQNPIETFNTQFARMGFTNEEMIQVTACGHTLGGVHADDFPNIVTLNTVPNDFQLLDGTLTFDNEIALTYINGPQTDALVSGPSVQSGRNSDFVVFSSDQNVTLQSMTDADTFNTICTSILQKMIETVDPTIVTLTDPVQPYDVKPAGLQLTLLAGGTHLSFAGDIRVRTTTRSADQIASVQLEYTDRTGAAVTTPIVAAVGGTANGFDDSFTFYAFSSTLDAATSISSFNVIINLVGGTSETYDNNGSGYPISDTVIVQTPQSCFSNGALTVVAAIRSTSTTPGNLLVTERIAPTGGVPTPSPLPSLSSGSVTMTAGDTHGSYQLYSATYTIGTVTGTKYGVESGTFGDTFKDASDLGATCLPFGDTSTSSISSTGTATSTSVSPTATATHKPIVGDFTFQGCYTDGNGVNALDGASFTDATGMTMEECAEYCSAFPYFGVENGDECTCGNSLGGGSALTAIGECNLLCPGDSTEYCGAANRLELYKLTSLSTSTIVSSTGSTSLTNSSVSSTGSTSLTSTSVSSTGSTSFTNSSASSTGSISSTTHISTSHSITSTGTVPYGNSTTTRSSTPGGSIGSTTRTSTSNTTSPTGGSSGSGSSPATLSTKTITITSTTITCDSSAAPKAQAKATEALLTPTVSAYTYYGCRSGGSGALVGAVSFSYDGMTLEKCAATCESYKYWGVENGGDCHCGSGIAAGSSLVPDAKCSFKCPGDEGQFCGAENLLTTFVLRSVGT